MQSLSVLFGHRISWRRFQQQFGVEGEIYRRFMRFWWGASGCLFCGISTTRRDFYKLQLYLSVAIVLHIYCPIHPYAVFIYIYIIFPYSPLRLSILAQYTPPPYHSHFTPLFLLLYIFQIAFYYYLISVSAHKTRCCIKLLGIHYFVASMISSLIRAQRSVTIRIVLLHTYKVQAMPI